MVDMLGNAMARSNALINTAHSDALRMKGVGISLAPSSGLSQLSSFRDDTGNRQRYGLFRGTLYAAINALSSEGASQEVQVGRLKGTQNSPNVAKHSPIHRRHYKASIKALPNHVRTKAAKQELEVLYDHAFIDLMAKPNNMQSQWQFTYSFIANLLLTGWSYIVGGENEEGNMEFYSLPTTWIKPNHEEGPFTRFKIKNPNDISTSDDDSEWLTRENVAFAHLPNPSDPMGATAPSQAQMIAIRIEDHIQASQEQFFSNGIFPSVVVTVGKDPHPDVPGGMRPRLTGVQRRQVIGAIRKAMGGVQNYGNPAIVDGLIENITKMSMTQNEMGWDKSEDKVKARILSTLSVHPYMLGEAVPVGGYAQVNNIEKVFYKKVNTYTGMLGSIMTNFAAPMIAASEKAKKKPAKDAAKYLVWWEPSIPIDPQQRWANLNAGRTRGDISKNEIRVELGLPPDETGGDRTHQFTSADLVAMGTVAGQVAAGTLQADQVALMFATVFDLEEDVSLKLAGTVSETAMAAATTQNATAELKKAVQALGFSVDPDLIAESIVESSRDLVVA